MYETQWPGGRNERAAGGEGREGQGKGVAGGGNMTGIGRLHRRRCRPHGGPGLRPRLSLTRHDLASASQPLSGPVSSSAEWRS